MQSQIKDLDRLLDIQEFSEFVLNHRPESENVFKIDQVLKYAILKALENIGEAANQISKQTKEEFNQLDWKSMIAARHVYVHDYFKIDWTKVWEGINTIDFDDIISGAEEIIQTLKKRFSL